MIISSIYMISYQTITSNHNILFQQHISLSWDCGGHHPHPAFPSFPGIYLFLVGLLFGCICLFILLICLQINFFLLIVHLLAYQFFCWFVSWLYFFLSSFIYLLWWPGHYHQVAFLVFQVYLGYWFTRTLVPQDIKSAFTK